MKFRYFHLSFWRRLHTIINMRLLIFISVLLAVASAESALKVYTIESPPLVQKGGGGVLGVTGLFGNVVSQKLMESSQQDKFQIVWVPWKRALTELEKNKKALFFPLTRTTERESKYHWISHLASIDCWVYAIRPDIRIDSLADLKKYRVGVLAGSLREEELRRHMGVDSKNIEGMTQDISNYKKLVSGRIDIWVTQSPVMEEAQAKERAITGKLVQVRQLKKLIVQEMWLVGNRDMAEKDLELVRSVFGGKNHRKQKNIISSIPLLSSFSFEEP